jgi:hypothetical protein
MNINRQHPGKHQVVNSRNLSSMHHNLLPPNRSRNHQITYSVQRRNLLDPRFPLLILPNSLCTASLASLHQLNSPFLSNRSYDLQFARLSGEACLGTLSSSRCNWNIDKRVRLCVSGHHSDFYILADFGADDSRDDEL